MGDVNLTNEKLISPSGDEVKSDRVFPSPVHVRGLLIVQMYPTIMFALFVSVLESGTVALRLKKNDKDD
jgi:hypothetical protein